MGVKAVGENALGSGKVQLSIFVAVIGLLKNGDIINATFMQIGIFIAVYWINFYSHNLKVLARQLAGLANIIDVTHFATFAC